MVSTSHRARTGAAAAPSYQATGSEASCACSSKPYGLTDVECITHAEPSVDHRPTHRCPGRRSPADGTLIQCGGALQLERVALQLDAWKDTPAVMACTRCPTRVAVLMTVQRVFCDPMPATFRGHCPFCSKALRVDEKRPTDGEWSVKFDHRFREAGFHAVPACQDFRALDMIDLTLRVLGTFPTSAVRS